MERYTECFSPRNINNSTHCRMYNVSCIRESRNQRQGLDLFLHHYLVSDSGKCISIFPKDPEQQSIFLEIRTLLFYFICIERPSSNTVVSSNSAGNSLPCIVRFTTFPIRSSSNVFSSNKETIAGSVSILSATS